MRGPTTVLVTLLAAAGSAAAADFDVGPGQPLAAIADVPWESLQPGDTVRIHWRPEPYREKWVIGRQGMPGAPITVLGVRGPGGERPVISGESATTPPALDFWNDARGLIKIGGSSVPPNTTPQWIVIEGLELRSAHPDYQFADDGGNTATYADNAAGLYVEVCRNLVVRDCVLHDNGNGLFIGSPDANPTRDVLVEGCWFHGNGVVGSAFHHDSYTEAIGITFQANRYGPLRPGADGNALKDRSAGLVVRYNWIEGCNRQLDLVNAGLGSAVEQDPGYRTTHVYGNVLLETEGSGNRQVVHYGGDSGDDREYRKGTLHFYNNTVVSERAGRTTLLRLSTNDETCDARNVVVFLPNASGDQLELVNDTGTLDWTHAWLEPGWAFSFFGTQGTFNDAGTTVEGTDPGFVDAAAGDYTLLSSSPLRDAGTALHPDVLPDHDVLLVPAFPLATAPRPSDGTLDIGAHEVASLAGEATDLRVSRLGLSWQPAPGADTHDVVRGDVGALAASGLGASVLSCLGRELPAPQAVDGEPLPASGAVWYLARGRNTAGTGTWGVTSTGMGRDADVAAAPSSCAP